MVTTPYSPQPRVSSLGSSPTTFPAFRFIRTVLQLFYKSRIFINGKRILRHLRIYGIILNLDIVEDKKMLMQLSRDSRRFFFNYNRVSGFQVY